MLLLQPKQYKYKHENENRHSSRHKERGYTITSFCQKFDLKTQNIIQNYIKGNPTIKRLEDLCEKLDCDITDLFYPVGDSSDAQPTINTTAFCPHCGAKVRVGVMLLPEE